MLSWQYTALQPPQPQTGLSWPPSTYVNTVGSHAWCLEKIESITVLKNGKVYIAKAITRIIGLKARFWGSVFTRMCVPGKGINPDLGPTAMEAASATLPLSHSRGDNRDSYPNRAYPGRVTSPRRDQGDLDRGNAETQGNIHCPASLWCSSWHWGVWPT